jgi:DNA-binding winged helix-turn-helix (wHTH) protein/predicted ATPase
VRNENLIIFDAFSLDLVNECLWLGSQAIRLRPKAFLLLRYLLSQPGRLLTKEELLNAVWPGTFVGEAVLKVAIRQIRDALGDDPAAPRFIETAHRRGYRFIGSIAESVPIVVKDRQAPADAAVSVSPQATVAPVEVVGRDAALERMHGWLADVLRGERQIVFVTGEAGIGKTALVDAFTRNIASGSSIRIGRGQCLEQYGTSEAYLPVLEAMGRLCREQKQVVDVLRTHAPMWLLQMPSLVSAADREVLHRQTLGATRERMLREMGEALEALTRDTPLVLILEDLHWSDYSTLDLISYLASQRQAAHLMLIGTYRPVELAVSGHPLLAVKRELLAKQHCEEVPLEYLSEESVGSYLAGRFCDNRFPGALAALIHGRTEGNPLFMVNAVDFLLAEGGIGRHDGQWELIQAIENIEVGVPESIRQVIEKQIDHLDEKQQRALEAASVAGAEFSTPALAAGLVEDNEIVEALCDGMARHNQFIQASGVQELPGGTTVARYRFIHALYQNVLYERVLLSRRGQIHQRIGEQLEALYGDRAGEIAAELAMHFERGSSDRKAVRYLKQAADNDIRRFAYRDAVELSRRALQLLEKLPDSAERDRQELAIQINMGMPLIATEGYAAPGVGSLYARARELCRRLGETPETSLVFWGLWTVHLVRAELSIAREIAGEFLQLPGLLPYPSLAMEITLTHLGEFAPALEYFDKALSLVDPERHRYDAFRYSQNPGVGTRCHAAWALWFIGAPDMALKRMQEALDLASDLSEPHGLAHTLFFKAVLHQLRREDGAALECSEAAIAISREHGLVLYEATAMVSRGWALTQQGRYDEAIAQIRRGIAGYQATGTELLRPHFLALLAEALARAGKVDEGLAVLEDALAVANGTDERYYQAELYRLKGELLLQRFGRVPSRAAAGGRPVVTAVRSAAVDAGECFERSVRIAQQQNAHSLLLRALMSIARHYPKAEGGGKPHDRLSETFHRFAEGFETRDLRDAKALLDEMSQGAMRTVAEFE